MNRLFFYYLEVSSMFTACCRCEDFQNSGAMVKALREELTRIGEVWKPRYDRGERYFWELEEGR